MRTPLNLTETAIVAGIFVLGNAGGGNLCSLRPASISAWIIADRKRQGLPVSLDYGWYALYAWPIVLPYHLFRTRGRRGCLTLLAGVFLFCAAYALSLLLFYVLRWL